MSERVTHAAHHVRERVSEAAHFAQGRVASARDTVTERVSSVAHAASRGARHGAERARAGFWQMLERNPLALGAIAFGVGIAAGASAPTTEWEDERLGRYSGPLKDEAKRAVQDTAHKVKTVAREAVDAARSELEHQREQMSDPLQMAVVQLKQSARETLRAAEDAARQGASEEGLDAEGLKETAREVRDRAR